MTRVLLLSLAGAIAIGAMLPRDPPTSGSGRVAASAASSFGVRAYAQSHPQDPVESTSHEANIRDQYSLLLDALRPAIRSHVLKILAKREAADRPSVSELVDLDRELSLVLGNAEYALYEQLRESSGEQAFVRSFEHALERTSPLTAEQRRSLLLARLRSKDAVAALELTTSVIVAETAGMEDVYALDIANAGLSHYRAQFLAEAELFLNDEQWAALVAHENIR